ncbi:MAG: TRAP transporter small permease [Treponema sp.]|jgi:TRAP-type C4-dicarboxylate transport system permease small subunit|nr:TRAP transporter small permease [Treponema sp.]
MNDKILAVQKTIDKIVDLFGVVLFTGVFFVILLQVGMRFFNMPLVWSEELARYLFMWVSLIGWVFATRNGTHIRVSIIADHLPGLIKRVLGIANFILTIIFAGVLCVYGFVMIQKNVDIPTITLFFSYAVVYAAVPFSTVLIIFYTVIRFIQKKQDDGGTLS